MVNKKMQKGKSIEEIAEDLEEDKGTIEKIANVIRCIWLKKDQMHLFI